MDGHPTTSTLTISQFVQQAASIAPQSPAVLADGREPLSYTALLDEMQTISGLLRSAGIVRGDRVATALPNGPEMAVAFLGIASAAAC